MSGMDRCPVWTDAGYIHIYAGYRQMPGMDSCQLPGMSRCQIWTDNMCWTDEQILGIYRCQVWTNVGCDRFQAQTDANRYGQLRGMDRCQVRTHSMYGNILFINRCWLWTGAGYGQMPVMSRCRLWTDTGYKQMLVMHKCRVQRLQVMNQT